MKNDYKRFIEELKIKEKLFLFSRGTGVKWYGKGKSLRKTTFALFQPTIMFFLIKYYVKHFFHVHLLI